MQAVPPPMVRRLDPADVPLLYPLVRLSFPHLTLREWMRIGRRLARPGARARQGILVARYGDGRPPCGMATFRRGFDLCSGDTLTSDYIITLSYTGAQTIIDALLPAMETLAREWGCDAMRTITHSKPVAKPYSPVLKLCSSGNITERTVRLDHNT
ncbi:hypothetical protein ACM0P6_09640 [Komagataeibacter sucrofermentans]|nr:hypothetical protein [Komagataeibacter sucrofermentans]GBQ44024.1 hypothetical protein AA15973_0181 [Komagataeibacter sucrofermentans DSM 15973]